ncbi:uncharacterized protein LOC129608456 [Condylostylus longicornis]|uniref:uncharacterized protein LOC129608456 n=1 Tax=Condylostylus longicornis TaxID=2530218 RepID=UPI00244E1CE4|nr:uncharacterized protein LOC129608456 [Condylostylus longicornis]
MVPRDLVWQAIRLKDITESHMKIIMDMCRNTVTRLKSSTGVSHEFLVTVGVHHSSALSPYLFNLVMDYVTLDFQRPTSWNILYADDVVLINPGRTAQQNIFIQLSYDVKYRSSVGWLKCRSVSGVLCDKKMPINFKGRAYRTVARSRLENHTALSIEKSPKRRGHRERHDCNNSRP